MRLVLEGQKNANSGANDWNEESKRLGLKQAFLLFFFLFFPVVKVDFGDKRGIINKPAVRLLIDCVWPKEKKGLESRKQMI